jgi:hypothetical protein
MLQCQRFEAHMLSFQSHRLQLHTDEPFSNKKISGDKVTTFRNHAAELNTLDGLGKAPFFTKVLDPLNNSSRKRERFLRQSSSA